MGRGSHIFVDGVPAGCEAGICPAVPPPPGFVCHPVPARRACIPRQRFYVWLLLPREEKPDALQVAGTTTPLSSGLRVSKLR